MRVFFKRAGKSFKARGAAGLYNRVNYPDSYPMPCLNLQKEQQGDSGRMVCVLQQAASPFLNLPESFYVHPL
jgi:hypothetical protein